MNEAGFYKLSMDLRDLARKIPLHWGQVQNNKVDDKINMFDIYHYEELEKQIASLPITSQNYLAEDGIYGNAQSVMNTCSTAMIM